MCIAGSLGIFGTRQERSTSRNYLASVFMGFFITSAVFGGIIIIFYGISIDYHDYRYRFAHSRQIPAVSFIVLILSIVELLIGIWAAFCFYRMNPCKNCNFNAPQQRAVTPGAQEGHPQMFMVPIPGATSGAMATSYQPQQVALPPPYDQFELPLPYEEVELHPSYGQSANVSGLTSGVMATGNQFQQVELPPLHGQNEQIPVTYI